MTGRHQSERQSRALALENRASRIREAVEAARSLLPKHVVEESLAALDRVGSRLELGVEHTVVALVGGTGSGKSSTFNAVSQLEFADVGARRPTTSRASACVWSGEAGPLLDFLGIARDRRIERASALDDGDLDHLRGLVLLDLPDHDSIAADHARQVDRLLPLVDLLVWVLDPQKYADHSLHQRYLRELSGRQESMIAVVNQADTLAPAGLSAVAADVRSLLADDGLGQVPVLTASARTGHGIPELRRLLAEVVGRRSAAEATASYELDLVADALRDAAGAAPEDVPSAQSLAEQLADAVGVPAVTASIEAAFAARSGGASLREPSTPSLGRIRAVRDAWLAQATSPLAPAWSSAMHARVADAATLRDAVEQSLGQVEAPQPPERSFMTSLLSGRREREAAEAARAYRARAVAALAEVASEHVIAPAHGVLEERAALWAAIVGEDVSPMEPAPS